MLYCIATSFPMPLMGGIETRFTTADHCPNALGAEI